MRGWVKRWLVLLAIVLGWTASPSLARAAGQHVVKRGETLSGIAHDHGVSVAALCRANRISPKSVIRPGQKLTLPGAGRDHRERRPPRRVAADAGTYAVRKGDTLSGIAARHQTSVAELRRVNGLRKGAVLKVGQELRVPGASRRAPAAEARPSDEAAAATGGAGDPSGVLSVPGAGPVYFHAPTGPGRLGLRPVLVYLHGRGGSPQQDCARWARLASRLGWVVCPGGPVDRGGGRRAWNNDWPAGQRIVMASLAALRERFGRRVQLYGNTLIGFSEGAFVAMNVGVREPKAFNRWLILAASDHYWGLPGREALGTSKRQLRRVYLLTGSQDSTHQGTLEVKRLLHGAGVPVRSALPEDLGHELLLERKASLYRTALEWLVRG